MSETKYDNSELIELANDFEKANRTIPNANLNYAKKLVAGVLIPLQDQIFRLEGNVGGHAGWKPLKNPSSKRGSRPKILQDTGVLRASIQTLELTATKVTRGTSVPYAIFHQEGYGVPQREFMFIPDTAISEAETLLANLQWENINLATGAR